MTHRTYSVKATNGGDFGDFTATTERGARRKAAEFWGRDVNDVEVVGVRNPQDGDDG